MITSRTNAQGFEYKCGDICYVDGKAPIQAVLDALVKAGLPEQLKGHVTGVLITPQNYATVSCYMLGLDGKPMQYKSGQSFGEPIICNLELWLED